MLDNITFMRVSGLVKRFGDVRANDEISIDLNRAEIHAILGENGAGKSTLMKMLYGLYPPDSGTFETKEGEVSLYPPLRANQLGVRMVFQQFNLVPTLTVLENVHLFVSAGAKASRGTLRTQLMDAASRYGLHVRPDAFVWELDLGERQRVEILKALLGDSVRLIIFDEPTSVLTPQEVEGFLAMLRRLREDGLAVLFITHKINEVLACADRVTVLRSGRVVHTVSDISRTTREELVIAMLGAQSADAGSEALTAMKALLMDDTQAVSEVNAVMKPTAARPGHKRPVLTLANAEIRSDHGRPVLQHVDFQVHAGEVVGIVGVSGNGQRELLEVMFGLRRLAAGSIHVRDRDMRAARVADFIASGVSYLSEDPRRDNIIPGNTVLEHMVLAGTEAYRKGAGIDWERVRKALDASASIRSLELVSWQRRVDELSGGNVQRVMLARAIAAQPSVLLLSYPSRGLDVRLVQTVHQLVEGLKEEGCGVVFLSEDLAELQHVCDTLYVLGGQARIVGPLDASGMDPLYIGSLMTGGGVSA